MRLAAGPAMTIQDRSQGDNRFMADLAAEHLSFNAGMRFPPAGGVIARENVSAETFR